MKGSTIQSLSEKKESIRQIMRRFLRHNDSFVKNALKSVDMSSLVHLLLCADKETRGRFINLLSRRVLIMVMEDMREAEYLIVNSTPDETITVLDNALEALSKIQCESHGIFGCYYEIRNRRRMNGLPQYPDYIIEYTESTYPGNRPFWSLGRKVIIEKLMAIERQYRLFRHTGFQDYLRIETDYLFKTGLNLLESEDEKIESIEHAMRSSGDKYISGIDRKLTLIAELANGFIEKDIDFFERLFDREEESISCHEETILDRFRTLKAKAASQGLLSIEPDISEEKCPIIRKYLDRVLVAGDCEIYSQYARRNILMNESVKIDMIATGFAMIKAKISYLLLQSILDTYID